MRSPIAASVGGPSLHCDRRRRGGRQRAVVRGQPQHVAARRGEGGARRRRRGIAEAHVAGRARLDRPRGRERTGRIRQAVVGHAAGERRGGRKRDRLVRARADRRRDVPATAAVHRDRHLRAARERAVEGLEPQHVGADRAERGRGRREVGVAERHQARSRYLRPGVCERARRVRQAIVVRAARERGGRGQHDRLRRSGIHGRRGVRRSVAADVGIDAEMQVGRVRLEVHGDQVGVRRRVAGRVDDGRRDAGPIADRAVAHDASGPHEPRPDAHEGEGDDAHAPRVAPEAPRRDERDEQREREDERGRERHRHHRAVRADRERDAERGGRVAAVDAVGRERHHVGGSSRGQSRPRHRELDHAAAAAARAEPDRPAAGAGYRRAKRSAARSPAARRGRPSRRSWWSAGAWRRPVRCPGARRPPSRSCSRSPDCRRRRRRARPRASRRAAGAASTQASSRSASRRRPEEGVLRIGGSEDTPEATQPAPLRNVTTSNMADAGPEFLSATVHHGRRPRAARPRSPGTRPPDGERVAAARAQPRAPAPLPGRAARRERRAGLARDLDRAGGVPARPGDLRPAHRPHRPRHRGALRERLESHYAHYDAPPKLRITLPRGGYAPEFVPQDPGAVRAPAAGIAVLRTRNLTGDDAFAGACDGFADQLADRLAAAGVPRVIARASVDACAGRRTPTRPRSGFDSTCPGSSIRRSRANGAATCA